MAWKEINPQSNRVWDPEEEKEIEGTLVGIKEAVGPNKSKIYIIDIGEEKVSIWGSTVLDNKMIEVPVGAKVKITYEGKKDSPKRKGKQYKDFTVMIDTEYRDEEVS